MDDTHSDIKRIKSGFEVHAECWGTYITAVAISRLEGGNHILTIPSQSGDPICSEVYDVVRDAYCVLGVSYHQIGLIPFNFRLTMKGVIGWSVDLPVPLSVVWEYLTDQQRKEFEDWKSCHPNDDIRLLQTSSVY